MKSICCWVGGLNDQSRHLERIPESYGYQVSGPMLPSLVLQKSIETIGTCSSRAPSRSRHTFVSNHLFLSVDFVRDRHLGMT